MTPSETTTHAAAGPAALTGHFVLQPGSRNAIVGTRPITTAGLLGKLLRGLQLPAAQMRLGHVFTLCAHAHQRACALAFGGQPEPLALLRWETVRDHLRSMVLEWPQRLGQPAPQAEGLKWLQSCPIALGGGARPSVQAVAESLMALNEWLGKDASFPAQCLAQWRQRGEGLRVPLRPLNVLSTQASVQNENLQLLGRSIEADADANANANFPGRPHWQGVCAETGPWTRLRHAAKWRQSDESGDSDNGAMPATLSASDRIGARWIDLCELAAAPALAEDAVHDPMLSSGSLKLSDTETISWCEMARGLLLHWVRFDAQKAIADYRIISPTEWNFHPEGALAQALSEIQSADSAAAQTLAAAFDACVEYSVQIGGRLDLSAGGRNA